MSTMTELMELNEQVNSLDQEILALKSKIRKLENEKQSILTKLHSSESAIFDTLPARARNSLSGLGIDTDLKLKCFLRGDCDGYLNPRSTTLYKSKCAYAKTPVARLECIRNIGCGTARDVIDILQQHSDFLDIDDT